jgi:hypothetical protein
VRAAFPDDDAEPTDADQAAMRDIVSGGTGEVTPSQARDWTNEERVLGIVGDGFPYRDVLRLIVALGDAEERGRASAGATRDELAVARARLRDAEERHRFEVAGLLASAATAAGSANEQHGQQLQSLRAAYANAAPPTTPPESERLRDDLTFAHGQIDTFHAEIVKLQGELAAALAESNRASLALADAQEEAKRAKASARRRRRKL